MDYLLEAVEKATTQKFDHLTYHDWELTRIYGGRNGITYHASNIKLLDKPLAIKVRKQDEKSRALREFSVLQALHQLSISIAPEPIRLHTDMINFPGDVVITSWVDGTVLGDLSHVPTSIWNSILATLSTIHTLRPSNIPDLPDVILPIRSTSDVITEIENRYTSLPDGQLGKITKAEIGKLFKMVKKSEPRELQPVQQMGLILYDTNPSNMIVSDGKISVVDWEYSGWGDPAFDIADLLARPDCLAVSQDTLTWILDRYAKLMGSQHMSERILVYKRLMLIFWLILISHKFETTHDKQLEKVENFIPQDVMHQQIMYLEQIEQICSE